MNGANLFSRKQVVEINYLEKRDLAMHVARGSFRDAHAKHLSVAHEAERYGRLRCAPKRDGERHVGKGIRHSAARTLQRVRMHKGKVRGDDGDLPHGAPRGIKESIQVEK